MKYLCGIYKRVSTEERAQIIEGSLDSQEHRLKQFADFKNVSQPGWGNVVDIYSDEGLSAKDTKRPAFQRMMRDIRKGRINLILVTDLSRLSRNILDFCLLLEELKKYNAKFLSLKEQFDTSTPAGEMMVFNMINLAQFERKQTAERVSLNFHSRATRGLWNGGPLLLGYKADPTNKSHLLVDEVEAESVRKVFKLFLTEGTVGKTLKALEGSGIKPKAHPGRAYKRVNNGDWSRSTLYQLLRNPAYIGTREINKKNEGKDADHLQPYQRYHKVKATWPAIVDDITFAKVQKALDEIQRLERERLSHAHERPYIATGLLFCKECSRPLMGASASGAKEVHRYYGHRHIDGQKVTCKVKRHRADEIEETIVRHMLVTLRDEAHVASVIEKVKQTDQSEIQQHRRDRSRLEAEIGNIDRDIDFLIRETRESLDLDMARMYREKIQNFSQLKVQKTNELHLLIEKVAEAEDASDSAESLREALDEIHAGFKKATSSVKKRLLRRMLMRVDVTPTTLELFYRSASASAVNRLTPKTKTAPEHRSGAIVLPAKFHSGVSSDASGGEKVVCSSIVVNGRGDRIRTCDPLLPKQMRYQAALLPVMVRSSAS